MDNSKMSNDSVSMYYSFNETGQLDDTLEAKMLNSIENLSLDEHENSTLEACDSRELHLKTVVKKSPLISISKKVLKEHRSFASTPTKLPTKCGLVKHKNNVDDLGIAFLNVSQDHVDLIEEDKENLEVSDAVVPEIIKDVDSNSNLTTLNLMEKDIASKLVMVEVKDPNLITNSLELETTKTILWVDQGIPVENKPDVVAGCDGIVPKPNTEQKIKKRTSLKLRRSIMPSEPNLLTNKPSRIANNRKSGINQTKDIPKMVTGILKPPKEFLKPLAVPVDPTEKVSNIPLVTTKPDTDLFLKPAEKLTLINPKIISCRQTIIGNNKKKIMSPTLTRRSVLPSAATGPGRYSIFPVNLKRSALPKNLAASSSSSSASVDPSTRIRKSISLKKIKFSEADPVLIPALVSSTPEMTVRKTVKKEYNCTICSRNFSELSLLELHKKTHIKKQTNLHNQCRFCDKKFAIAKALNNHLFLNCTKIPPQEKRKLLLPQRSPLPPIQNRVFRPSFNLDSMSTSDQSACSTVSSARKEEHMPPPLSSMKVKKKIGMHSGIYRTPTKLINCNKCEQQFNHILSYSEHCLSHFSNSSTLENSLSQPQSSIEAQTSPIESISEYTQTSPKSKKSNKSKSIKKPSISKL